MITLDLCNLLIGAPTAYMFAPRGTSMYVCVQTSCAAMSVCTQVVSLHICLHQGVSLCLSACRQVVRQCLCAHEHKFCAPICLHQGVPLCLSACRQVVIQFLSACVHKTCAPICLHQGVPQYLSACRHVVPCRCAHKLCGNVCVRMCTKLVFLYICIKGCL